jgi:hypothetical protein
VARWIKADGIETIVRPSNGNEFSLEEMNKFVGGYLEAIRLTAQDVMYLNEQGLLLNLPINHIATQLVRSHRTEHKFTTIVGDVIIANLQETGDM